MANIHDLSENVDEIFEGYFGASGVTFHVSIQNKIAVSQISHIERIAHVPAHGSESFSLNDCGMEEAETEEDTFDFGIFFIDFLFGEVGEGSFHIGFQSGRRLISEFDGSVENTNWNSSTWFC